MKKMNFVRAINDVKAGTLLNKLILIFSLGLFSLGASATSHLATKEQIGMFKNSKTCIVLEDGLSSYNIFIKDAIPKYWKSTQYEYIDQQEFEKRRTDSKYSFLVLIKASFNEDPAGVSYTYLSLVLGDPAKDLTEMPELCSLPISYSNDNRFDYGYIIPYMVKFIQIHVTNLETKRPIISVLGFKYYNKASAFKDKVLLLNKAKMASDANTIEKIKTAFPHPVRLLSVQDIQKEIAENPANKLFNFHVGPAQDMAAGKCFEMIFDAEGNLYYYNAREITNANEDGFNLKDFSHIKWGPL